VLLLLESGRIVAIRPLHFAGNHDYRLPPSQVPLFAATGCTSDDVKSRTNPFAANFLIPQEKKIFGILQVISPFRRTMNLDQISLFRSVSRSKS